VALPSVFWNLLTAMALIGGIPSTSISGTMIMPAPPDMALKKSFDIEHTISVIMTTSGKSILGNYLF